MARTADELLEEEEGEEEPEEEESDDEGDCLTTPKTCHLAGMGR